ncbi:MAG: HAMP domain-containing histidine kinase [Deltaproteobacteria bacterium]|nr:HAMP domain-containing histidine kinase [Deltaproteobacteria bacterium]
MPLTQAMREAIAEFEALAVERGVEWVVQADSDCPVVVDPVWLRKALENLIVNALTAAGPGGQVTVQWGVLAKDEQQRSFPDYPGRIASVQVHDSGPGVPVEHEDSIFKPFFTTRSPAPGLGLPVARDVIEVHGGVLRLVRGGREGATFEIDLPSYNATPCWENRGLPCAAGCDACVVRESGTGYCCWVISAKGLGVETGRWPARCQDCTLFRASNASYFHRRQNRWALAG